MKTAEIANPRALSEAYANDVREIRAEFTVTKRSDAEVSMAFFDSDGEPIPTMNALSIESEDLLEPFFKHCAEGYLKRERGSKKSVFRIEGAISARFVRDRLGNLDLKLEPRYRRYSVVKEKVAPPVTSQRIRFSL